ncbi:MAG: hypothetical protein PVF23_05325, partial [Chromatiales bacterium]
DYACLDFRVLQTGTLVATSVPQGVSADGQAVSFQFAIPSLRVLSNCNAIRAKYVTEALK